MTERRQDLRAADADRQAVADRLQAALSEGRLTLAEYDERLRQAYAARTYGDLDALLTDLPPVRPAADSQVVPAHPGTPADRTGHPTARWLVAVWGSWLAAVLVCVTIWVISSIASGELGYFWPIWVAGPWGAVLLAVTFSGLAGGAPHHRRDGRSPDPVARRMAERARRRDQRRRSRRGY